MVFRRPAATESKASRRGGSAGSPVGVPRPGTPRAGTECRPRAYPPVIGGKKAISAAPAIGASGLAWTRSIAARTTPGFSKA